MAEHPLLGAWLKHKRANEHIEEFRLSLWRFREANTHPGRTYSDASGQSYTEHEFGAGAIWPEISCPAGDALHNLRSALDHVAFALAWKRRRTTKPPLSQSDLQNIYFSVRPTRQKFKTRGTKGIERRIGPDWVVFLTSVQPYQRRNARDLGRIVRLDNIDKHRALLRLEPFAEVSTGRGGAEMERVVLPIVKGVVRVPWYPDTDMTMVSAQVTFADAPVRKQRIGAEWELRRFSWTVADVIRQAQARFF